MDRLPQELIDEICDSLGSEELQTVACVSTKFRRAAGNHAHKYCTDVCQLSKTTDTESLIARYSGFRLRYLMHVEFSVHFPQSVDDDRGCCESTDEREERNVAFTEQIHWLFKILKAIESRAGKQNQGRFRLTILITTYVDEICHHREHAQWRTKLLHFEELPDLQSVNSLYIQNDVSSAKLDYRVLIDLAKRLPNTQYLSCSMGQDEWTPFYGEPPASCFVWDYAGPRRDSRHDFARKIMLSNALESIQEVDLDFICRDAMRYADHISHAEAMPDLVRPNLQDPFSTSLRILSYHLRRMVLRAQVDSSIFWPDDDTAPHWPYLEYFYLMFHMVSPSGTWFFVGPRGEGRDLTGYELDDSAYPLSPADYDDDYDGQWQCDERHQSFDGPCSHSFRISPNDVTLNPFLLKFAKAASNMPQLKRAALWSPLRYDIDEDEEYNFDYYEPPERFERCGFAWGFVYEAPGLSPSFGDRTHNPVSHDSDKRRIWWKAGRWRPRRKTAPRFAEDRPTETWWGTSGILGKCR